MTGHTLTIDDCSPLIDYRPEAAWFQQGGDADTEDPQYYGGSFTYTQTLGATASFSFNGTSVTIYGAKGVNYGNYSVNIDGTTHDGDAFIYSRGEPEAPLINVTSLRQSLHVVTLFNTGNSRLDIDNIVWTSDIGSPSDGEYLSSENLVGDISDAFEYHPEEAWWSQSNLSDFMGGTGHTTTTPKASVTYIFSGDVVSLYGTTGPHNSPYTVQLDDWPNKTLQANKMLYKSQSLLFHADNLGQGNHTLTLTNEADSKLQIDYAKLHRFTLSPSLSQFPMPGPTGDVTNQEKGLDGAQIAAVTIGGVVILMLIASLCLIARRNRTLWNRLQRGYMVQSQFDYSTPSVDSGYHVATSSKSSRNGSDFMAHASQQELGYSRNMSEMPASRPPAIRPLSLVSRLSSSASTLVAEDGSNAGSRRPHRTKRTLYRVVETPRNTVRRPSSPEENEPIHLPNPFVGRQHMVEPSASDSDLDIRVVGPEGLSVDGSPVMPSRSLAARGRSSPGPANWDGVQVDIPMQRERSLSPVPVLSIAAGETRRLIDPGQYTSPSASVEHLSLAGRTPRHSHDVRASGNYSLFRTRRYI